MEATRRTRVVDRQRDIASTSGTSVLGKTAAPISPGDRPPWRQMMSLPTSPDIGTPPGWPCRLTRRMTPAVPRRQGRRSYAALRRRDAVLARERVLLSGNQVAPSGPLALGDMSSSMDQSFVIHQQHLARPGVTVVHATTALRLHGEPAPPLSPYAVEITGTSEPT